MEANNTFARAGGVPTAPPPPAEVKVRTMKSDLAAMARSGGGLPSFESVPVVESGLTGTTTQENPGSKKKAILALIIVAGVVAVALIGYVVYLYLKK